MQYITLLLNTFNAIKYSLGCNSVFTWQPQAPNPEPLPPVPEIAPELSSPALLVGFKIIIVILTIIFIMILIIIMIS